MNEYKALMYARKLKHLFPAEAHLCCTEIGEGNLNLVFRIADKLSGQSIIIKQALPYPRVAPESWPLTLNRSQIEGQALKVQHTLCPDRVPKVHHSDPIMALTVMEDLPNHMILRKELLARKRYLHFASQIGAFLAGTLFLTSDFSLTSQQKKQQMVQFTNPDMCKISEDLIFSDPYFDAETNRFNPLIEDTVKEIWQHDPLLLEVAKLKHHFLTHSQALIHGDLHTDSIMVTEKDTKVIDPEFSFYGPAGFDIGTLFGSLLLSYVSQAGHCADLRERNDYQKYLLATVEEIWGHFTEQYEDLWGKCVNERTTAIPGTLDHVLHELLEDACGFAGCIMISRVIGLVRAADLESIKDPNLRAACERMALNIGQKLILERKQIRTVGDITSTAMLAADMI
nr:S-methyl-5-thioribose kinase [Paenibacillus hamazuiensis]